MQVILIIIIREFSPILTLINIHGLETIPTIKFKVLFVDEYGLFPWFYHRIIVNLLTRFTKLWSLIWFLKCKACLNRINVLISIVILLLILDKTALILWLVHKIRLILSIDGIEVLWELFGLLDDFIVNILWLHWIGPTTAFSFKIEIINFISQIDDNYYYC